VDETQYRPVDTRANFIKKKYNQEQNATALVELNIKIVLKIS